MGNCQFLRSDPRLAPLKEDCPLPLLTSRTAAYAGAAALAALLGITSYTVFNRPNADRFGACFSGNVAGAAIGGPFELVDETGKVLTDAEVFTKPALVYFGYASCPDVCPLDNLRNVEVTDILSQSGLEVVPVFISVDPARDTPAALAEYTSNFDDRLLGLTGSDAQVKVAAAAYKVFYQLPDNPGAAYEVDHTTLTYLVLPKTGVVDFFLRDTSAQEIADHAACYIKAG
jgi:protein SCO1